MVINMTVTQSVGENLQEPHLNCAPCRWSVTFLFFFLSLTEKLLHWLTYLGISLPSGSLWVGSIRPRFQTVFWIFLLKGFFL